MQALEFQSNKSTYNQLIASYSEKHRKYHNCIHLSAVLSMLDKVCHLAANEHAIELALWFHDAVYRISSNTNEQDSADWAKKFIADNRGQSELVDLVYSLIMATQHNTVPDYSDAKLIVDIDLSILGSGQSDYDKFEANIRHEYRLVPWFLYKRKRIELLRGFLARESIYSHQYFIDSFENHARKNISTAIEILQNG